MNYARPGIFEVTCKKCGKVFNADSPFYRVCDLCKLKQDYIAVRNYYYENRDAINEYRRKVRAIERKERLRENNQLSELRRES